MVSDLSRTLISTNAFGQKNKVPQEAVPQAVQDKVRHVENEVAGISILGKGALGVTHT